MRQLPNGMNQFQGGPPQAGQGQGPQMGGGPMNMPNMMGMGNMQPMMSGAGGAGNPPHPMMGQGVMTPQVCNFFLHLADKVAVVV